MFQGLAPFFDENSKILILGSFPSVKSRQSGFYYGNPQNRFWKMLSQVFDEKFENDIASKKAFLKKHNIALYDVVSQSDLSGSADLSLEKSEIEISDISFLLPPNTKVEKILCNGKIAFKLLTQNEPGIVFEDDQTLLKIPKNFEKPVETDLIEIFCLPSTSSANVRFDIAAWRNALTK